MNSNKDLNIKKSIILIFLLFSIFSFFILKFNIYINKLFEKHSMESNTKLHIEVSYTFNNYIENIFSILSTIADQISEEDLSTPEITVKKFDNIALKNNLKLISITNLNGIAYSSKGESIDVSDRDYFKNSLEGKRYISSIIYSKLDGKSSNVFSLPIFRNNEVVAVLWASISTDAFYEKLTLANITKLGNTFIINSNGNIIVADKKINSHPDNLNLFSKLNTDINRKNLNLIKNDFSNLTGNYIKLNSKTKDNYVLYYNKLSYNDLWIMSAIPARTLKASYVDILKSISIFNVISIFFIIIIFYIFFNQEIKCYSRLKLIFYKDFITNGKNESFINDNIFKIINNKENFAFISLEIVNIKTIINISGLKNIKFIIKSIYEYMLAILNEGELIVHSYLGEFKVILKYNNISELTDRLEALDFSKIDENIDFKMGVYLIDSYKETFDDMCSYVNIAKESITNSKYMIYNKELYKKEFNKFKLKDDIKLGIENKEFKAWFQPKYSQNGKTIIGAEALVRWYKYGSIISPYIFIPLCESTGLIKEIDELVFEDVCINLNNWIRESKNVVPISINLSRNYLDKPNFIETLEKYISIYKIPKNLINFEITESSLIQNEELLKNTISILHQKGFKVLLDDFGVGYSSIKSISDAKFDILKIDKSFIDGIGDEKWNNIIKFTINLSKTLGMKVVGEGIENEEQYKFLLDCNCDIFQGYYFNKPMNPEDFSKLI